MNTWQHISTQLERLARFVAAMLPGGIGYVDRLQVVLCPAGLVAHRATKCHAMHCRVSMTDARIA